MGEEEPAEKAVSFSACYEHHGGAAAMKGLESLSIHANKTAQSLVCACVSVRLCLCLGLGGAVPPPPLRLFPGAFERTRLHACFLMCMRTRSCARRWRPPSPKEGGAFQNSRKHMFTSVHTHLRYYARRCGQ